MILVLILLTLLSAPTFRVREAAQQALTSAPAMLIPLLEIAERELPSPEARRRCTTLVNRWYADNAQRLSRGRLPWIDGIIGCYYQLLEEAQAAWFANAGPDWPAYREATRLWLRARIAARQPYRTDLKRLWLAEVRWRWHNGRGLW